MRRSKQRRCWTPAEATAAADARDRIHGLLNGSHHENNPIRRLRLFEKYGQALLDYFVLCQDEISALRSQVMDIEPANHNLPWDDMEDRALVEWRARGDSLDQVARDLGRTAQACATRLSYLTGVPRAQIVQAFIEGTLDDVEVKGLFHGQVKKVTA